MRQRAAEDDVRRGIRLRDLYRRRMLAGTVAGACFAVLCDRIIAGGHGAWLLGDAVCGALIMAAVVHGRLGHLWGIALYAFGMLPWLLVSHGAFHAAIPFLLFVYAIAGGFLALWLDENRSVDR